MCVSPIKIKQHQSYKPYRGTLIHPYSEYQILPCGKCHECINRKIEEWQLRWQQQLLDTLPDTSYMLTLTYAPEHLPTIITPHGEEKSTLNYVHIQKYLKLLRRKQELYCKKNQIPNVKITYHGCGEYGKQFTKRPHYHLLITNCLLDISVIQDTWRYGKTHYGTDITPETIKYILKYQLKSNLDNKTNQTKKLYYEKVESLSILPFDDSFLEFMHSGTPDSLAIRNRLGSSYHHVTLSTDVTIEKKLLGTFYVEGHDHEYCHAEKTFCSKGIGKNYLTSENIQKHLENPALGFAVFDLKKKEFKSVPLPRYYKESIFNPKKRDENGKIMYNENGNPINLYDPKNLDYSESPRYKSQYINYQRTQARILQEAMHRQLLGEFEYLNRYYQDIENRNINYEKYTNRGNFYRSQNAIKGKYAMIC